MIKKRRFDEKALDTLYSCAFQEGIGYPSRYEIKDFLAVGVRNDLKKASKIYNLQHI